MPDLPKPEVEKPSSFTSRLMVLHDEIQLGKAEIQSKLIKAMNTKLDEAGGLANQESWLSALNMLQAIRMLDKN